MSDDTQTVTQASGQLVQPVAGITVIGVVGLIRGYIKSTFGKSPAAVVMHPADWDAVQKEVSFGVPREGVSLVKIHGVPVEIDWLCPIGRAYAVDEPTRMKLIGAHA